MTKGLMQVKRPIAAFMLLIFLCNLLTPATVYALTSGPAQPEMKGFEPATTTELVDPFTGDFTYNIPLMDVGGYPVNIAYHSGSGMDDEASWVGFGWSLNPGIMDRQLRGLPDDFKGDGNNGDKITKEFNLRNDITGGVDFSFSPEVFGFDIGKIAKVGVSAGIFYNNKRGLGVQFGLNASAPLLSNNKSNAGTNTAGLSASASLNFNSQNGASFNPAVNYAISAKQHNDQEKNTSSLGLGASISSRAGLQYTSLGLSFNTTQYEARGRQLSNNFNESFISYAAQTFLPETQADYFNQSYALAPQFGSQAWGLFAGLQLTGHYSMQKVANRFSSYNAYGFMHNSEGKYDSHGLMDFNREKDVPYFDGVPNLPIPVATPDLFMAYAQGGSAQYRAYLGGTGIFSDHDASNTSISASLGVEIGSGAGFKIGGDVQASFSKTSTTKWKSGNRFLYEDNNSYDAYGNFTGAADIADAAYEPVYFKRVGENVPADGSIYDKVQGSLPVRVKTNGTLAGPGAENILSGKDNSETLLKQKITRDKREVRNNVFSYLTNEQVGIAGLDKKVTDYYIAAGGFKPFLNKCAGGTAEVPQPYKKSHHIGEITITDEGGGRNIYGIPAYNTYQEDVSFSVGENTVAADRTKGLVSYSAADASVNNKNGLDHYYCKEIIPGYAHAFLLTGILSPDYVDLKGDGITDDDLGTAVKFNYWRKTNQFQWRTPYAAGKVNFNDGLQSDKMDNRGNYSYGRKELWYVHSIESKTMVAVFETANREDALGADAAGNTDKDPANRQQYLKTIKLYAKADWYKDAATAMPLKTVHFVYDYSLFSDGNDIKAGIPNNTLTEVVNDESVVGNLGGKLTLKKIYFTYQGNTKGALQPYEFRYEFNKTYEWKQYDRWGNYKNIHDDNPAGVTNDYYVYSTQDKTKADTNAALWQLTQVLTPAGAVISVQYEADDYSYVQNRKAMQMYPMAGVGNAVHTGESYYKGDKIFVQLPETLSSDAELRAKYFDGGINDDSRNLFFKALVKLKSKEDKYDYVSGYATIENINTDVKLAAGYNNIAEIKVQKIKGDGVSTAYHPIAKAAWQFMRVNTPALVYPGYNVREDLGPLQFVKALVGAITSITELLAPFDTRAEIHQLAPSIDLSRSWVRLDAATNSTKKINGKNYSAKLGGGSRVKEVLMSDEWNSMSQSSATTAEYGMVYDYTTALQLADGEEVLASSGVASYEPMIGNEENPFHQPNKYQQTIRLGPDNAFFIDEPLCESYFPAPAVGYSRITVRNKGADGQVGATGYTINEFYTQRDYPTMVDHTPVDSKRFGGASILQLLNIKKNNSRVVSQGYTIVLNDITGKPKSEKIIDKAGNELSAVYYYYKTENNDAPEKKLSNEALVLQNDGSAGNAVIGRDIEMYSDMRSQTSITAGVNVMLNIDAIYVAFAIVPIPVVLPLPNAQYTGFRSAATVKIIQQFGILDKIIKRQNGSQITTENIAWDAGTGEVLLSRTQNEFDDPVYHLSYPSHWIYEKGMGAAYKNLGFVIANFSAIGGSIVSASTLLVPGDELLVKQNDGANKKYWVNNAGTAAIPRLVLIDADGNPATVSGNALVVRSGRRNMHSIMVGSLVSMVNPLRNGRLDIGVFTKVIDAGAGIYNDEWAIEAKNIVKTVLECPAGYLTDASGRCYKDLDSVADPSYSVNTTVVRQKNNLYSTCGTFLTNLSGAYLTAASADPPGANKLLLNAAAVWQNGAVSCGTGTAGDLDGPLNRTGIWLAERKNSNYFNQWVGVKAKVYISKSDVANKSADGKTGYLFLGFGSQHSIEVRIDNVVVAARSRNADNANTSPFRTWRIKPIAVALDQQHEIFIKVKNESANGEAVMGVELYNNTYNQLRDAACVFETCLPCNFCAACRVNNSGASVQAVCATNLYANSIWSTKCLVGKRFTYHTNTAGTVITDFDPVCNGTLFEDNACNLKCRTLQRIYAAKIPRTYCDLPVGQVINPYTVGLRGNWRLQKSFAYHTDRETVLPYIKPGDPDIIEKTDIRRSGAYTVFSPFWQYQNNQWLAQPVQPVKDVNWVKTNELTVYNQKGQETENADALNRYNAALFGYARSAVTAVAFNARYTAIGYDGFEDYDFDVDNCNSTDTCNLNGHFSIRKLSRHYSGSIGPDASYAHTGRNSLKVSNAVADASITGPIANGTGNNLYTFSSNTMLLSDKGILRGFTPEAGKQYLVSTWIKDDGNNVQLGPVIEPSKAAVEIIAGGQTFSTVKAGPVVEGWRKVEVVFLLPAAATDIKIRFRPGSKPAWFDDLRIHPFDAQIKTYAYDNRSMRLWAELDENNFATFYEYDDEGVLIRIKKETERGIMTIKESRLAYKLKK